MGELSTWMEQVVTDDVVIDVFEGCCADDDIAPLVILKNAR